jgi:hypothetical protein
MTTAHDRGQTRIPVSSPRRSALSKAPVGRSNGIDDAYVTEEDSYEANEPHDGAAQDGRAKPVSVRTHNITSTIWMAKEIAVPLPRCSAA